MNCRIFLKPLVAEWSCFWKTCPCPCVKCPCPFPCPCPCSFRNRNGHLKGHRNEHKHGHGRGQGHEYGLRMTRTPGTDMYADTRYRVLNISKLRPFSNDSDVWYHIAVNIFYMSVPSVRVILSPCPVTMSTSVSMFTSMSLQVSVSAST